MFGMSILEWSKKTNRHIRGRTDGQFHFSDQFYYSYYPSFYFYIIHSSNMLIILQILVCPLKLYFCVRFCIFLWLLFPAVDCGQPQPMQNGSITGGSTVYPNVMHFNCDEGFILRGSSKIQCQTNGTWSKTSSFCDGKQYLFCHLLILYILMSVYNSTIPE